MSRRSRSWWSGWLRQTSLALHLWLMLGFCVAVVQEDEDEVQLCLPLCSCQDTIVNCKHAGLQHLPRFPSRTTRIILDHNQISHITDTSLKGLRRLEFISLKHNNITVIDEHAFIHLENLHTLFLDDNWLRHLPENVFARNSKLSNISLMGNEFSLKSLNATLSNTPSLIDVNIEDNYLMEDGRLPDGFSMLGKLRYLEMGANDGIRNISELYFESLTDLPVEYLGLGYCPIRQIHPAAFMPLSNVTQMDLSYTGIRATELKNALSGLQNSSLRVIHLAYVFIHDESHLTSDVFEPLSYNDVHVLNLEGNYGGFKGYIHNHFFRSLRHLKELYLDNCQLHSIYRDAFKGLARLRTLSLSRNLISCLSDCDFLRSGPRLRGLLMLDLSHNVVSGGAQLRLHVDVFPKLHTLLLSHNRIASLHKNMFVGLNSLVGLDLSDNPIAWVEAGSFQDLHSLSSLMLRGGHRLDELPNGTFRGLKALNNLNLERNNIKVVRPKAFHGLRHLQNLSLNGNLLGLDHSSVLHLPKESRGLVLLDLSNNRLERIPKELPDLYPNLRRLLMAYNHIYSVDSSTLSPLRRLYELDLSYNDITVLLGNTFEKLYSLKLLDLAGNPFICTCELKGFVDWMRGSRFRSLKNHNHMCLGPHKEKGSSLVEFTPTVWECKVKAVVLPTLSVLGLLTILIIICMLYCRINTPRPAMTQEDPAPAVQNRSKPGRPGNCTWIRELLPLSGETTPSSDDTNPEEPLICDSPCSEGE